MSKHTHHQSIAEQIGKTGHASAPFHYDESPYQERGPAKLEDTTQTKIAVDDSSIKLRAYQIHLEKGGSDLDNWLEAERSLKNSELPASNFINEHTTKEKSS